MDTSFYSPSGGFHTYSYIFFNLNIKGGSFGYGPLPVPGIKCYIFAYDSVEPKTLEGYLEKHIKTTNKEHWFDYVTVLDKFVVFMNDGSIIPQKKGANFIIDTASKWTILGFFIHLVNNLYGVPLHRIDWDKYLIPPK